MIVDQNVAVEHLADLAEAGFPGLLLVDLVELTNDLMDRLQSPDPATEIWEVACQAFNNAIMVAGRSSSIEKLTDLARALARFHDCLSNITDSSDEKKRKIALEYIHHTEKRQEVVAELVRHAEELSTFEIPLSAASFSDEFEAMVKPR
jgi:hypothetical protein